MKVKSQPENTNSGRRTSGLTRLLSHRFFPGIFQWMVLAMLLFTAYAALFTSSVPENNFALVFIWIFWGTLAPLSVLLFGRFWCSMCPFHMLGKFLNRKFGKNKPIPRWLRQYGFWIALVLFIVIIWFEHAVNIFQSTILTLLLLVPVLILTVVGALAYRYIEFSCHGICPFLPILRNYSMISSVEISARQRQEVCSTCWVKSCYHGSHRSETTYGCPVGLYPRILDNMQECIDCGDCFKACPSPGTIQARFRNILCEFKRIRFPKMDAAMFASLWPGVLAIHYFTLLPSGDHMMQSWMEALGTSSYVLMWTLVFVGAILASLLVVAVFTMMSSWIAGEAFKKRFASFAYVLIPLGAGIHTAFNMPRFFGEQGLNRATHNLLAIFGYSADGRVMVLGPELTRSVMFVLLGAGLIGSLIVLRYTAQAHTSRLRFLSAMPLVVMIAVFTVITGAMFHNLY